MTTEQRIQELLAGSQKALNQGHPLLRQRVEKLIELLAYDGLYFGAFMGLRSIAEQDALYAQGRTTPGKIVTNAKGGSSWHNFGLAVDLVEDGDPSRAGIQWSWANNAAYLKIGKKAEAAGLEWGGFWKSFKDYPHVQLIGDLTLQRAKYLVAVGGLEEVWKRITDYYGKDS
jgi:peptidoglycan L-alanyl-D-glutamate endopeptidase CwlK